MGETTNQSGMAWVGKDGMDGWIRRQGDWGGWPRDTCFCLHYQLEQLRSMDLMECRRSFQAFFATNPVAYDLDTSGFRDGSNSACVEKHAESFLQHWGYSERYFRKFYRCSLFSSSFQSFS